MTTPIALIYAGGTFGCHGTPLCPLAPKEFLPTLLSHLPKNIAIDILPNEIVKDSSHLNPSDFVHFYTLIDDAYHKGTKRFILITGTDSLSFLGAFLANALAHLTDISVFITGSMYPLFDPTALPLTINPNSDAWDNLCLCLEHQNNCGVFVAMDEIFWAGNTQKINSQTNPAFVGHPLSSPPKAPSSHPPKLTPTQLKQRSAHALIKTIYLTPSSVLTLDSELTQTASAIILIGFGAGNVPKSPAITNALDHLKALGIPVICTSMCPFGGVSASYGAGAWQYEHGVYSGGNLSVAGIYGRLLWQYLNDDFNPKSWQS